MEVDDNKKSNPIVQYRVKIYFTNEKDEIDGLWTLLETCSPFRTLPNKRHLVTQNHLYRLKEKGIEFKVEE